MNHVVALIALAALFYSTEVMPQSASSSLNITITIPEVLHVVSNQVATTTNSADQTVTVRANLRSGYCVQSVPLGADQLTTTPSLVQCSSAIGQTAFTFRHQYAPGSAPSFGVTVAPQ